MHCTSVWPSACALRLVSQAFGGSVLATYAISGSASGIGAATRARLESAGHSVIGIDLHRAEVTADLSGDQGRSHAVAETLRLCDGRLDGLVVGAGVGPPVASSTITEVNYFGSLCLLSGLRPALAAAGESQVVQIGSNSATVTPDVPDAVVDGLLDGDRAACAEALSGYPEPLDTSVAYAAAKTAITRWCRRASTTDGWTGAGIRLNVIAPGAVQTPLLEATENDETFGPLMQGLPIPAGRALPEQIAEWIMFLMSPAARCAVGSVVYVDGGSDAVIRADDWPRSFGLD